MNAPIQDGCVFGSKTSIKAIDHALNAVTQLHKDWDNGLALQRPNFVERHIDGEVVFYIQIAATGSLIPDPVNFHAVLDFPRKNGSTFNRSRCGGGSHTDGAVNSSHRNFVADEHAANHNVQHPMLVGHVEVMDDLHKCVFRISRVIRLHPLDNRMIGAGNAPYYSTLNGVFEFIGGIT